MSLEDTLFGYFDNLRYSLSVLPLTLGGIGGSGGGNGGPPGGFIGYLPQSRVAYDLSEDSFYDIMDGSNPSLVDNLNRIRFRITALESGSGGSGGSGYVAVYNNEIEIDPEVTVLDFQNNIKVVSQGTHNVGIQIVGITPGNIPFIGSGANHQFTEDSYLSFNPVNKILNTDKLNLGRKDYIPIYGADSPKLYLLGEDNEPASWVIESYGEDGYPLLMALSSRGIAANPLPSASGDNFLALTGRGRGTTGSEDGSKARIYFRANQDHTDDNQGTRFDLELTPNNSTTPQNVISAVTDLVTINTDLTVVGELAVGNILSTDSSVFNVAGQTVIAPNTDTIGLIIQTCTNSPTQNMQEWRNVAGDWITRITNIGAIESVLAFWCGQYGSFMRNCTEPMRITFGQFPDTEINCDPGLFVDASGNLRLHGAELREGYSNVIIATAGAYSATPSLSYLNVDRITVTGGVATAEIDITYATLVSTGQITAPNFVSNIGIGTAPLTVTSTTLVSNLNADLLDGNHASAFLTSVTAHNILSTTHGDTTADTVVRGDIITGQGTTPTWARLAFPSTPTGKVLQATATDVGWSSSALGTAAFTASSAYEVAGAVSTHAALTTGIHGLAITAGQTLTVTSGGTLGSAAYTASTAYLAVGATAADSSKLGGSLPAAYALVGQTMYIGTTAVTINRGSGALSLAGVNIDGNAGTVTNGVYLNASNSFTLINPLITIAESWIGPSATAGIYFKDGNIGIGTTNPSAILNMASDAASVICQLDLYGHPSMRSFLGGGAAGTQANPSAVQANCLLFGLGGRGYATTGWSSGGARAAIDFRSAEIWTDAHQGAYIGFRTTPIGTATLPTSDVMRLTDYGCLALGTISPNANAILDLTSTTKAFMPPGMTTTQKNNIPSPTERMVVYDLTLHKLCVYTTKWETVTSS